LVKAGFVAPASMVLMVAADGVARSAILSVYRGSDCWRGKGRKKPALPKHTRARVSTTGEF